ncbi:MAG: rhomboid family intramembrane serine protease [Chloroflexi bacterium]|nr:rhomboid family intramembrane serine protease [Chloroflexota bacterium]
MSYSSPSPIPSPSGQSPQTGYPQVPAQQVRLRPPAQRPLVTWAILVVTVLIFLLQNASLSLTGVDLLAAWGEKINAAIIAGQLWRLITPLFLHASILHIGFNMYALYVIGRNVEMEYGHLRYLALYFLAGFSGNVLSFIFTPNPSLGASTAIFGLLGAEGIFIYQNRRFFGKRARPILTNIVIIAAVNLVLGLSPGIDNWGHLGGLMGGLLFSWFGGPVFRVEGIPPDLHLVDERQPIQIQVTYLAVAAIFAGLAAVTIVTR